MIKGGKKGREEVKEIKRLSFFFITFFLHRSLIGRQRFSFFYLFLDWKKRESLLIINCCIRGVVTGIYFFFQLSFLRDFDCFIQSQGFFIVITYIIHGF